MTSKNNRAPLLYYVKLCTSFQSHRWFQTGVTVRKCSIWDKISYFFFVLCDLEIWGLTLKSNRAPLLYYLKLCASFQSHRWTQTGVPVRKRLIGVKIGNFLSLVTVKFDRRPWKLIGRLFYATWRFVNNFIAICVCKLELQSGNANLGRNQDFFCPMRPWNLTNDLEKQ